MKPSKQDKPATTAVGHGEQPPGDDLPMDIRSVIERVRQQASTAVNASQTSMYRRIGQRIHTELLGGERAPYGARIVTTLSRQLTLEYGRGFAEKNLWRMVTVLPLPEVLHRKLHEAIETARTRIDAKDGDAGQEKTA